METLWFVLRILAIIVVCYFIGNISFARILASKKHVDISKEGSGNPGTMNMVRTVGLSMGILTFLLEAVKGVVAALIGYFLLGYVDGLFEVGLFIGGFAGVIGQACPVVYKFKGGKGMGVAVGVFFVANWWIGLIGIAVGILFICITDYGASASLSFLLVATVSQLVFSWGNITVCCLVFAIWLFIMFLFRENIVKMILGKERKMHFTRRVAKLFNKNIVIEEQAPKAEEPKKEEVEKTEEEKPAEKKTSKK